VQLAGHTGKDHLILQIAAELEKELHWDRCHPPIWVGDL
jgi:Asp-tRNA(Asn)/Glu-tRNA(Gln) amidotransferase A subunit family amidase